MSNLKHLPCGSWASPLSPELAAAGAVTLGYPATHDGVLYWTEGRPAERGRSVLMSYQTETAHQTAEQGASQTAQPTDIAVHEVLPSTANVRSRVHEYGGMPYTLVGENLVWSRFEDQRLCVQSAAGSSKGAVPRLITPAGCRYADGAAHPGGQALVAVCEDHRQPGEARNSVVWLDLNADLAGADDAADAIDSAHAGDSANPNTPAGRVLYADSDFVAWPRISHCGTRLALVAWDHPNMPWDDTRLLVGTLAGGALTATQVVAGGPGESVLEPHWAEDGQLYFLSDRSGWWNLYRWREGQPVQAVTALEAELGGPLWVLGSGAYTLLDKQRALVRISRNTVDELALLQLDSGLLQPLQLPFVAYSGLCRLNAHMACMLASAVDQPPVLIMLALPSGSAAGDPVIDRPACTVVRAAGTAPIAPQAVSHAEPLHFTTAPGADGQPRQAHAWFYPPCLPGVAPLADEKPPLLVLLHGGPTSQTGPGYKTTVQFWTTRGYCVVDVNYGGSSGYGRAYRERLRGQWGVVDLQDAVAAVDHLAALGLVDGQRVAIRGGSAGGFTVLAALTFHDVFAAGASRYGIGDLAALASDTHKFESRYLDGLIGPWPDATDIYRARSPIHHTDQLSAPMIILQGLDDAVVPPNQAEMMVAALEAKGVPHAYLAFEGEGHGFRRAETIVAALEAEYSFFAQVFGFEPADDIDPLTVIGLGGAS